MARILEGLRPLLRDLPAGERAAAENALAELDLLSGAIGGLARTKIIAGLIEGGKARFAGGAVRLDKDGLTVKKSAAFFGEGSFGGGEDVVFIGNRATAPSSNPTGGGILYAESGALKWRGSSGTVTTIANA